VDTSCSGIVCLGSRPASTNPLHVNSVIPAPSAPHIVDAVIVLQSFGSSPQPPTHSRKSRDNESGPAQPRIFTAVPARATWHRRLWPNSANTCNSETRVERCGCRVSVSLGRQHVLLLSWAVHHIRTSRRRAQSKRSCFRLRPIFALFLASAACCSFHDFNSSRPLTSQLSSMVDDLPPRP
jgi:hypothetical protein